MQLLVLCVFQVARAFNVTLHLLKGGPDQKAMFQGEDLHLNSCGVT